MMKLLTWSIACSCVSSRLAITSVKINTDGEPGLVERGIFQGDGSVTFTLKSTTPLFNVKVIEENPPTIKLTALLNYAFAHMTGVGCRNRAPSPMKVNETCILESIYFDYRLFAPEYKDFKVELVLTGKTDKGSSKKRTPGVQRDASADSLAPVKDTAQIESGDGVNRLSSRLERLYSSQKHQMAQGQAILTSPQPEKKLEGSTAI